MFDRAVLVHYHEIGLKGRNRARFEKVLQRNLQASVGALTEHRVSRIASRLLVKVSDPATLPEVLERASRLPGVSYVAEAYVTARDLDDIEKAAVFALREVGEWDTFRIEARRSNTDFPVSSQDVNVRVGSHVVEEFGRGVDLSHPDATCHIEIVQGDAYVYARRVPGPGGLPVGTGGTVVSLLSAGIDSPVASWRMMRRGAAVVGVHFSGAPHTDESSIAQVHRIGQVLEATQGLCRICAVRFGDVQKEISLSVPPALRVLLYRRLMIRIGEAIAGREGASALVTGESLGQVASQTLANVVAVDDAATLPVLRPLIGSDKVEIIDEARRIGTYDISTEPGDDCCTLFMPRMPATRATVEEVRDAESGLDVNGMIAAGLATMTVREFASPACRRSGGRAS